MTQIAPTILGRFVMHDHPRLALREADPNPMILANEGMLAQRPLLAAGLVALWCLAGAAIAVVLARRGHDLRSLGTLGIVLGPLLLAFARSSLRLQEEAARSVVLRPATPLGGDTKVLVAVLGEAGDVADVLPVLRLSDKSFARVDLVRPVTYEAVGSEDDDPELVEAERVLEHAAVFLHDYGPGMLLVPGRGAEAVARVLDRREVDLVLVVGDDDAASDLRRLARRRRVTIMVGTEQDEGR